MLDKKIFIINLLLLTLQTSALARAVNSSVIMELWSGNIDWAKLVNNGPKEFIIQNEKITVKLEEQMPKQSHQIDQEITDIEVFRDSKESSVEHSITEVLHKGSYWEIIIKNPKLNSCF